MGRRLGFWAVAGVLAIAILPSVVHAQAWLEDRRRAEGPGFRLGDFELHPGIGLELGYDSNLFYSPDSPGDPAWFRDTAILRAAAHLMFSTRGMERRTEGEAGGGEGNQTRAPLPSVQFRGGLSGSFYHFFNANERTNMEANANLALTILPGRPFSIDITEEFGRSVRPFADNTSATPISQARIDNQAGVTFNFATPGEILRIRLGYQLGLNFFEAAEFHYGNRMSHTISLGETFRFLPQTAVVHDTNFTYADYFNPMAGSAASLVNDGALIRTRAGLNGAITNNFSVLGVVGYAAGFYSSVPTYDMEYESVVAQLEARWQIMPNMRLAFGYDRDFHPSFIGNFYRRDRGYVNYQLLIGGQFLLGAEVSLGYYEFGSIVRTDPMTGMLVTVGNTLTRGDIRFQGQLFAEYRFTEWLGVNATFSYTGNFTDYQYLVPTATMGPVPDPAQFNKFQLWAGVRAFY